MGKYGSIAKDILLVLLASGGMIALTATLAVMPGLAIGLAPLLKEDRHSPTQIRRSFRHLRNSKLVRTRETNGKVIIELTEAGRTRALEYKVEEMRIERPEKWDERWHLVAFDIPNKFRLARDVFRNRLRLLGFYPLQESLWIFPYACRSEIDFLTHLYGIDPFVKTLIVTGFPKHEKIKLSKIFGLKVSSV